MSFLREQEMMEGRAREKKRVIVIDKNMLLKQGKK